MRDCLNNLNEPGKVICVGLDPDLSKIPLEYQSLPPKEGISRFLREIVQITAGYAVAFKLQKAFFDLYGGSLLMKKVIEDIRHYKPDSPVFIDGKIGDVENTMKAYLQNIFQDCNADGIVINPYMGQDVFNALSDYPDRGIAVLVRTSNSGAGIIQDVPVLSGKNTEPLWSYILDRVVHDWNASRNMIPILSEHANGDIREKIPDDMPILYAGVGIQNGDLRKICKLYNSKGGGVIVNSSRAILYPYDPGNPKWRDKVYTSIKKLYADIEVTKNEQK